MLDIQFKECCRKCNYVEIDHAEMISRAIPNREAVKVARIFCRHAPVCKAYLESDETWQGKNQT